MMRAYGPDRDHLTDLPDSGETLLSPGWILPFWMVPAGWLIETQIATSQILAALFWFGLAAGAGFFQPLSMASRLGGMAFGLAGIAAYASGRMGSADVLALLAMGLYLGLERLLAALFVACITALGYAWASHTTMVPFLSFLAYGFILAMFKGYTLIDFFYSLVRL